MIGRLRNWFSPETRASYSYTDLVLTQQLAAAKGYGNVRGSAGYRSCLNLIDDAASAAVLTGDHTEVLQSRLGEIARALVDRGSSAWEMLVGADGRLSLLPVEVTNVVGGAEEATWVYALTRTGPSETSTVAREQAGVLNFRARPETRTPWRGQPALESSNSSSALLAALEGQLTDESRIKVARVISAGVTGPQRKEVTDAVADGGIVTISGSKQGSRDPAGPLSAGSIGAGFEQPSVELHQSLTRLVCGALGVPSNLVLGDGDGASAREAFRRMSATTINSTLLTIQNEWQAKVSELSYSLDGLKASDQTAISRSVGSRANAFSRLVSGGVEVERALKMAGLS